MLLVTLLAVAHGDRVPLGTFGDPATSCTQVRCHRLSVLKLRLALGKRGWFSVDMPVAHLCSCKRT